MWNFNFIPFKYLFYHFMKTLPLALDALLCIGALLVPAFLASCREASERQDQIRFGLFPNVTHVQGLVARHFSRTGEGWFEKRIFERTGKNISILWYAYNAGPSAMEAISLLLAPSLLPVLSIPLTQRFHKFGVRGNLSFAECFSREIGPCLIKGTANIGVAYLTAQELLQFQREAEGRHIATRRLLETRILLLAGTRHPFASLESVTMDMVCGQRLVTAKGVRNDAILGSAKLSCPKITNFSDISLMVQAVAEQNMVAFLPEFTILSMDCAQISSCKVLPAVETQEENRLFLCLLHRPESRLRYQEKLLLSCIREQIADFLERHPEFTVHSEEGGITL